MKLTTDVRRLLAPLDPAGPEPLVATEDRDTDLRRITASGRPRGRHVRRRLVVATAAAGVLVVAFAGYEVEQPEPAAAAATPEPLTYTGGGGNAAALLSAIATRAAAQPPLPAGRYDHLVTLSWFLWSRVEGKQVRSAIVPSRTERWRGTDNSGKITTRYEKPQFPPGSDRSAWLADGGDGLLAHTTTETHPAGAFPAMWPDRPPATGFAEWLAIGHPTGNGPAETIVAATDLVRERVLTPADRAALLRVLATLPGLSHDGEVTDRAGRRGTAFSLVSGYSGLPTRYTLIVDPDTGGLLGFEQTLTEKAGRLGVRIPAVIGYETYVTAEVTPAIGR